MTFARRIEPFEKIIVHHLVAFRPRSRFWLRLILTIRLGLRFELLSGGEGEWCQYDYTKTHPQRHSNFNLVLGDQRLL